MTYGNVSMDVMQTSDGASLGAGNASIMKNRIINGACVIDQRNAGASVTPTGNAYTLDRWSAYITQVSKFSVQQNAGSVTPPVGFSKYLGVTSLSTYSIGAGDLFTIGQPIEGFNTADLGWGTANAKTVTLSAWVYSSLTGTFGGAVTNSAQNRSYPFAYSISVANTWTQISVTIAGDTTGTWIGANNGVGMYVHFGLGAGSTYSGTAGSWAGANYFSATGATSVVGTSGATFYITGCQLERGSSATGFEYRQYGQELALCQRYYQQFNNDSGANTGVFGSGYCDSATAVFAYQNFVVTMRTSPTATYATASKFAVVATSSYGAVSAISGWRITPNGIFNRVTVSTGTAGQGCILSDSNTTGAYVQLSAEL